MKSEAGRDVFLQYCRAFSQTLLPWLLLALAQAGVALGSMCKGKGTTG